MSLIHEALKKAEAQRHLGEAPTLNTPSFARRRRRRWLLPLAVLAIILAGGYLVWSFWPASHGTAAGVAKTAASPAARTMSTPSRSDTPAAGGKPPAPAHATRAPKVVPTKTLASIMKARENRAAPSTRAPVTRPATPTVGQAAKPKVSAAPAAPAPSAPIKPLTKPAAATPVATAATPAQATTSALPLYWQLPYAERKDLPELKISMHVYAPNPADRFVIINGARQVEGDDLGNSITLVAIRRDGIVVELNGKRFVVPTAAAQ